MLTAIPITAEDFAPFGEVVELGGEFKTINEGFCRRYSDLATLDIVDGAPGISLFDAEIRSLPYDCGLLERHPLGSQCFIPMRNAEFLVIVAPDAGGRPGAPRAFVAGAGQGVNIGRNVWHGVLCPISGSGLFAVVDRIGPGPNLEEVRLPEPVTVTLAPEG
ncbi:Ureidoglycolate hydrolase [Rhodovulum sp. BSW8]|uniref:ureidoglycolate lyase n=1 Tax=Rhodovulum sp. BSW8 TaxID=2259645 RepID=UPI000DE2BFF4|nr:ureidoglycolate lyase [Rhodovulum sp. BSW8]RBO54318.1 Ureidoglycolate hydrolase [Rhodovulum sp. BSW8]